jgi:hypothetical protein
VKIASPTPNSLPEAVGERARHEHQGGQRERVGVDHPLQVGEAGAKILADRRQRHVDDRDVEQKHEGRHRDGDQGPPLAFHLNRSPRHVGWISFVSSMTERDEGM